MGVSARPLQPLSGRDGPGATGSPAGAERTDSGQDATGVRAAVEGDTGISSTLPPLISDPCSAHMCGLPAVWSLETPRGDVERMPALASPQPASGLREHRSSLEHLAPDQVRFSRTRSQKRRPLEKLDCSGKTPLP